MPTNIRQRVYLYASKTPAADHPARSGSGSTPGELPTGKVVGTITIAWCRWSDTDGATDTNSQIQSDYESH